MSYYEFKVFWISQLWINKVFLYTRTVTLCIQFTSLPQRETPLQLLFSDVLQCCLQFSFVFMISLNLYPFNHVSIFENQNKQWRLGWRSTEARYNHHLFFVRHQKKPWIHVAWRVVMMQQSVLFMPLVGHFLPTASIKTLSTPIQNSWFTGWHWRKNSFWKIASLFKKKKQTTCSWSLTSTVSTLLDGRMTLPLGWLLLCSWVININPAFISCSELRMEVSFLFGLSCRPLHRASWFGFWSSFSRWA